MGESRTDNQSQAGRPFPPAAWLAIALVTAAGCSSPLRFPAAAIRTLATDAGLVRAYDTDGDRRPDYFTTQDEGGRIILIAYDTTGHGEADAFIRLDDLPISACRHVIIILDGVGYETVEAFRREGGLRLFHPPVRLISTFPAMTDLALADAFRTVPCVGYEVVYFDRRANRLVGGDADYLSMKNEAWAKDMAYRAGTIWDALAYIFPGAVFNHELSDFEKVFDRRDRIEVPAYFVATAGLGTRLGSEGQRRVLETLDRLAEELVWRTGGLVKVTVLSDHGHALVRAARVDFRSYLRGQGWRAADRLEGPRDVAVIEYGLVTYAAFAARDRPALAATLIEHPAVDLVTYPEGEAVVVERPGAKAVVERRAGRYRYRPLQGDPLELAPIIEKMAAEKLLDADGFAEDAAWFARTLTHKYPDCLDRLWRAFNGLVENPPDVIASLKDGYFAGLASRAAWLPYVASTHGDLGRKSSTAFIMSTAGPLMPAGTGARHRDVPAIMQRLEGREWPPSRQGGDK